MNSPEDTVYRALKSAYDLHEKLGAAGQQATESNQFGDVAMVADIGAERAMVDVLRRDDIGGTVHSEELGIFKLPTEGPKRLIVMDGLDGSSVYKRARGTELYGTMLAVFENDDPYYDQYLAAGIALHSLHMAILASPNSGLTIHSLRNEAVLTEKRGQIETLEGGRIFVDDGLPDQDATLYPYFKTNYDVFGEPLREAGLKPEHTGSSAAYYALLALGKASMVGEATRKGNLEFASAYPIVREAGGTMTDVVDNKSLGNKRFLAYGQDEHRPTLAAANADVEQQARGIIRTNIQIQHQR